MDKLLEEGLRQALPDMPSDDLHAVAAFAEFLAERRRGRIDAEHRLSEEEHARQVRLLDMVAALSAESGPPVSNRDHDHHLYGAR